MSHRLVPLAFAAISLTPGVAFGQPGGDAPPEVGLIELELNKVEQSQGACRAYFVVENGTKDTVKDLSLDVFVFDRTEVIAQRVGLSFNDIRPDRRKVVLFDLEAITCEDVGELLVNDILTCESDTGDQLADCRAVIATSSRVSVKFAY
jgi:hypothetical protein